MTALMIQHNFTHGELDRRLYSIVDLDIYYKTAKYIRNAYVRPQGGVIRRHGTYKQFDITTLIDNSDEKFKLESFILDDNDQYLLLFTDENLTIYKKDTTGVLTVVVPDSLGTVPWTKDQVEDIQVAQNGDFMVITHPEVTPHTLIRGASDATFNLSEVSFKNLPAFDFSNDYYNITFHLDENTIKQGVTLTSSAAIFGVYYAGGMFISLGSDVTSPLGVFKITDYNSETEVTGDVIAPFDSSIKTGGSGVIGSHCFLGEPAFSQSRGWPSTVSFYESRLCYGGTPQLPQTVFLSNVRDFNNFDIGTGLDDQAIIYTLSSSRYNKIKHIISDRSLQVFCTEAEFSSMQYFAEPLTPGSTTIRIQSSKGSSDVNIKPQILDGKTLFIRAGGKSVMAFAYDDSSNSYISEVESLYSAHLIKNPISGAILKGDGLDDADYLFLCNDDGSLVSYQSLDQEGISAWTLSSTGQHQDAITTSPPTTGFFKKVVSVQDTIYCVVKRNINKSEFYFIEEFSFDKKTDCTFTNTYSKPTTTITGLDYLEGEIVNVIDKSSSGNDILLNNQTVTDGQIEIEKSVTAISVGLPYSVIIETIPINVPQSNQLFLPKRIVRSWIDYYESSGIYFNDSIIPDLTFGPSSLDNVITPKTGVYQTDTEGWGQRISLNINQPDPLPLLIIGIGYEVTT